jgi:hypothetical protein
MLTSLLAIILYRYPPATRRRPLPPYPPPKQRLTPLHMLGETHLVTQTAGSGTLCGRSGRVGFAHRRERVLLVAHEDQVRATVWWGSTMMRKIRCSTAR